jgi:hypothetical protein
VNGTVLGIIKMNVYRMNFGDVDWIEPICWYREYDGELYGSITWIEFS